MKSYHAHIRSPLALRSAVKQYGADDGVFGLDDAFQVIVTGGLLVVAAGVALAIGPHPFSDPFGMRSSKKRKE